MKNVYDSYREKLRTPDITVTLLSRGKVLTLLNISSETKVLNNTLEPSCRSINKSNE